MKFKEKSSISTRRFYIELEDRKIVLLITPYRYDFSDNRIFYVMKEISLGVTPITNVEILSEEQIKQIYNLEV